MRQMPCTGQWRSMNLIWTGEPPQCVLQGCLTVDLLDKCLEVGTALSSKSLCKTTAPEQQS